MLSYVYTRLHGKSNDKASRTQRAVLACPPERLSRQRPVSAVMWCFALALRRKMAAMVRILRGIPRLLQRIGEKKKKKKDAPKYAETNTDYEHALNKM